MKKKILLVTLATVLTLSMTACGGKETETPATDTNVTVEQTVESSEPTTSPEVEQTVEEAKDEQSGLTVSEVRAIVETMANAGTYTYDDGLAALMTENNISADFARDVLNAYIMENTSAFPAVLEGEETTEVGMETPAWMQTENWEGVMEQYEACITEDYLKDALARIEREGWTGTKDEAIMHEKLYEFMYAFWNYFGDEETEGMRPGRTEIVNYAAALCNSTPELAEAYLMMNFDRNACMYTEEGTIDEITYDEAYEYLLKAMDIIGEQMVNIMF